MANEHNRLIIFTLFTKTLAASVDKDSHRFGNVFIRRSLRRVAAGLAA
jgi:hypothetical protein